jgi:hypothetical protein
MDDRSHVARRHEACVHPLERYVGYRADARHDGHQAGGHALEQRVRQAFGVISGQEQDVGRGEQPCLALAEGRPGEAHLLGEIELVHPGAQPRLLGALARHDKLGLNAERTRRCKRLQALEQAFRPDQAPDIEQAEPRGLRRAPSLRVCPRIAVDAVRHQRDALPRNEGAIGLRLDARQHDHHIGPGERRAQPRRQHAAGEELRRQRAAVHLIYDVRAAQFGDRDISEVAPVGARVERRVDMHDRRAAAQDFSGEPQRACRESQPPCAGRLGPTLAAHLEMGQREPAGQRTRVEQQIEMGAHAADRLAARTKQDHDGSLHAASLRLAMR